MNWRVRTLSWPTSSFPARVILLTDQFVLGGPIRRGAASAGEAHASSMPSAAATVVNGERIMEISVYSWKARTPRGVDFLRAGGRVRVGGGVPSRSCESASPGSGNQRIRSNSALQGSSSGPVDGSASAARTIARAALSWRASTDSGARRNGGADTSREPTRSTAAPRAPARCSHAPDVRVEAVLRQQLPALVGQRDARRRGRRRTPSRSCGTGSSAG